MQYLRILLIVGTTSGTSCIIVGPSVQSFANQAIADCTSKYGGTPTLDQCTGKDLGGYSFTISERYGI